MREFDLEPLFETSIAKTKTCLECNLTSTMRSYTSHIMQLPVNQESDLQSLLQQEFQVENFNDNEPENTTNRILCENCNRKTNSDVKKEIESSPQVLAIQSLRYWHPTSLFVKITPNDTLLFGNNVYKLKSVCVHHGRSLDMGHYTCLLSLNGKWSEVNDDRPISPSTTPLKGFLYFYERQDSSDNANPLQPAVGIAPSISEMPTTSKETSKRANKRKSEEAHTTSKDANPPKRSTRRKTTNDVPQADPKPAPKKTRNRKSAPVVMEPVDDEFMNADASDGDDDE